MKTIFSLFILIFSAVLVAQTEEVPEDLKKQLSQQAPDEVMTAVGELTLPPPFHSKSERKISKVSGWTDGKKPKAPTGFVVTRFADDLIHPRWTYLAPNGDYFVSEANTRNSADRISILRDSDEDGEIDMQQVFLEDLNQPFGMLVLDDYFYVANTDGLYRYPYKTGQDKMKAKGEKILSLSASGYNNHWTRNIMANKDGSKILVTVGSASNVGDQGMEKEKRRACIIEINPDGSGEQIYADGLRNPVGMDYNPITGELWTAVNERDKLGNDLVPDYMTSVKRGGWYGWPYSYYGHIKDPRWRKDPHQELVDKAIVPDVPLGPHTASLGLVFYDANSFPKKYKNGAFIGQHGSWNRAVFSGYKVVFVPFDEKGKPMPPEDFLTGFIAEGEGNSVYGRPVGVTLTSDGSLLVNDDDAGVIWKVAVAE